MANKENDVTQKKNRSRGDNWTQEEKDIFMEIMQLSAPVIENKKTDTNTNKRKHLEWLKVQDKLKELAGKSRDIVQLKGFWRRAKLTAKKSVSQHRRALNATGGGQPPPSPSEEDRKIIELCVPIDFVIDTNNYDSDAVSVSQITEPKKSPVLAPKILNSTILDESENIEMSFLNESVTIIGDVNETVTIVDVSDNETDNIDKKSRVTSQKPKQNLKKAKCGSNNSKAFIYGSNVELKKRAMELMEEEFKLKIKFLKQELCHQEMRQKLEIDVLMMEKERKRLEIEILKKTLG